MGSAPLVVAGQTNHSRLLRDGWGCAILRLAIQEGRNAKTGSHWVNTD